MMTRDQARAAYRRVADWEKRQSDRLREAILVRYFGGCMCRMHNHVIAEERGQSEGMDPREHRHLAKLAKRFHHEQRQSGIRPCACRPRSPAISEETAMLPDLDLERLLRQETVCRGCQGPQGPRHARVLALLQVPRRHPTAQVLARTALRHGFALR